MKRKLDMDRIAEGLGAERRGKVSATGGYFGAMQLLADVEAKFRVPAADGSSVDGTASRPPRPEDARASGGHHGLGAQATGNQPRTNATCSANTREDDESIERGGSREARPAAAASESLS